ncbi:MAG: beta-lactamase family protein [Acidobacteriia bacterium]|nr:beta-lactamase family protein [Terriglobia bacterium]
MTYKIGCAAGWLSHHRLTGFAGLLGRSILVLMASFPLAASDHVEPVEKRMERVENGLLPASLADASPAPPWTIQDRIRHHRVPGVSVAVIHNFAVDWARGYGVLEAGSSTSVNTETLFQAASISKPVAAMGLLSLVQGGKIDLDDEVNRKLTSWRIPENQFTAVRNVTLRHLLTHMAGTTIPGYVGYTPGAQLPTLVQILNGQRPANAPPVVVDQVPGTQFRYSGGGYAALQQLAIDLTRMPFEQWMRAEVLGRLEMDHSTYE